MKVNKELNEIAEKLSELEKCNAYKVPEGYFSSLTDSIEKKLGLEVDLRYSVPGNYFENLPGTVLNRIENTSQNKKFRVIPMWMRYASIAASFVFILFMGNQLISPPTLENVESSDEMEYLEYLSTNIGDIDASTLLNLNILEDNFEVEEFTALDDSMLDFYLESNLDEIELAYLEDIFE